MSDRPPLPPLTAHLGYWLRHVSNHVSHGFARKLEGRGVTVAEWVFLRTLYDADSIGPSRLAERLGMTRGAISKLAVRLIDKKLVARAESEEDERAHLLSLTDAGLALVPALAALADANDAEWFSALSAEDRATIERLMRQLVGTHGLSATPVN
ncbi:MarR family transcriptional regulator [Sphingomonas sp. AOB5]|uniref:MarR family winged helix-turn-helix transcriptional regulator n=1 Tax=Sphingomonas sp. AOB5 TaxID=3034017 RepID=UPI0023F6BC67|nr:MarR family transcriptional regulator [Sphingomonas sp. AOB5]MDF7774743.1 MarR family transcriptional regulator [Sphingomonas sp. AOB5]